VLLGSVLGLLAVAAALVYRRRLQRTTITLDDSMIRSIETHGVIDVDEPLDLEAIREEEERFLEEERWDEADEW
jgi:hypothetical protein